MKSVTCAIALGIIAGCASSARAHVPYIERFDYTWDHPLQLTNSTRSIAAYGWLQSSNDYDVIEAIVTEPNQRLTAQVLVPVCPSYKSFVVRFGIFGQPSSVLTQNPSGMPFPVPVGFAYVAPTNEPPLSARHVSYEPFGGKRYYDGATLDITIPTPGVYYIVVWNDQGKKGDYVLAVGYEEIFTGPDMVRALVNTKVIRQNGELHTPCGPGTPSTGR